jgi:hypothetical protein
MSEIPLFEDDSTVLIVARMVVVPDGDDEWQRTRLG